MADSVLDLEDEEFVEFCCTGGAGRLMDCEDFEILIEGPAGTGKTRAVLEMVHRDAELYDGCRQLLMRKSRSELTESVLVTFEDKVLPENHAAMNGPHRSHRSSYTYPNGSVLVLGGMDSRYIHRIMSTEYDRVVFFEAIEFTEENWQKALTRCRNGVMPYQQLIADTNPGDEYHWLNQRANAGEMTRVLSRHTDNPFIMEREAGLQYLRNLERLKGATRKRLLDGEWVGQEGQIFEEFSPAAHVKKWRCVEREGRWWIIDEYGKSLRQLNWFIGGIDWGWKHPGVQHVYGIDNDGSAYLVHEVYRCYQSHEWWLSKARAAQKKFGVYTWVADPSNPEQINYFYHNGVDVKKAMNEIVPGLDAVRDMLAPKLPREVAVDTPIGNRMQTTHHPEPALYFLEEALDSRDPTRTEARKPCRLTEEIPAYRWREPKEGQPVKEEPNPLCSDHAVDTCRYVMSFLMYNDWREFAPKPKYHKASLGAMMEHDKTWEGIYRGDFIR